MSSIEKALGRLMAKNAEEKESKVYASVAEMSDEEMAVHALEEDEDTRGNASNVAPVEENIATTKPVKQKIVHLDYKRLADAGYLTPDTENHHLAEEYRLIKRPLLVNAYGKGAAPVENGNMVMVTSALPAEGKTYTSINLAISIAMELDSTVLLVDGDILKAQLSHELGLEHEPGLMELLNPTDRTYDIADVLISTDLPRLKVLPAGKLLKNPTELLSSTKMRQLVEEMAGRYKNRIILFDAPPILATTEASSLMDHMGQILFVVEAGKSSNESVVNALEKINREKVIGTILNKSRSRGRDSYYGGYYGKRHDKKNGER